MEKRAGIIILPKFRGSMVMIIRLAKKVKGLHGSIFLVNDYKVISCPDLEPSP